MAQHNFIFIIIFVFVKRGKMIYATVPHKGCSSSLPQSHKRTFSLPQSYSGSLCTLQQTSLSPQRNTLFLTKLITSSGERKMLSVMFFLSFFFYSTQALLSLGYCSACLPCCVAAPASPCSTQRLTLLACLPHPALPIPPYYYCLTRLIYLPAPHCLTCLNLLYLSVSLCFTYQLHFPLPTCLILLHLPVFYFSTCFSLPSLPHFTPPCSTFHSFYLCLSRDLEYTVFPLNNTTLHVLHNHITDLTYSRFPLGHWGERSHGRVLVCHLTPLAFPPFPSFSTSFLSVPGCLARVQNFSLCPSPETTPVKCFELYSRFSQKLA